MCNTSHVGLAYLRENLNRITLRREKSVVLEYVLPDRTVEEVHLEMKMGSKQLVIYESLYHSFRVSICIFIIK
jgi:hypothetical protein